ncbi:MAG TPA: hypothetical protein PKY82_35145, partial [Pyrinomonadaceae bacterium]|nr:hypothetical protein [Pyrinomonadaceae bacterium]
MLIFILFFQRILGIPDTLLSGEAAKPIIEVSDRVWLACGLLFLLFTVFGVWLAQYSFIAKKTGGPAQYLNRAITVGFSLLGYKILFAGIMWTGAMVAYQIMPAVTTPQGISIPWIPASSLTIISPSVSKTNTSTTSSNSNSSATPTNTNPGSVTTPLTADMLKGKSTFELIMWGISNAFGLATNWGPAMLVVALCNIFFAISIFLISAVWLIYAIILYALGPFMITAGLIPEYGDKLWGNWIAATIQCSLWQVWLAFCGRIITSTVFQQFSQLNPANRVNSSGGELSGSLMDLQQAAFALVFLLLYVGTPFLINFIFPLSNSGSIGGFVLGTAAALMTGGSAKIKQSGLEFNKRKNKSSDNKGSKSTSSSPASNDNSSGSGQGKGTGSNNQSNAGTNARSANSRTNQSSTSAANNNQNNKQNNGQNNTPTNTAVSSSSDQQADS